MKQTVAIIGGGTAALFLAAFLDTDRYDVTIFEKNKTLGRKFLVAGDGGFNLTNSEVFPDFTTQYTPPLFLTQALNHFNNDALRNWLLNIGIPTFVGSSGRVFPKKGIKPIQVLKCIEQHLAAKNVQLQFNKTFTNWETNNALQFNNKETVKTDYAVFALGGASWKVTGSSGSWLNTFAQKGISTLSFAASNCAYQVNWHHDFINKHEGQPLKNIAVFHNKKTQKGEAVITKFGLEGNAIYALSPQIQQQLIAQNKALIHVDFKPMLSLESLIEKLKTSQLNSTNTLRQKLKLPTAVITLLKTTLSKTDFLNTQTLANIIKKFPINIIGSAPIDEAISTSGGIALNAVNNHFEINTLKNQFCIGEMLNWDAPTGGYLIQACASTGAYLAHHLNNKL